MTFEPAMEPFIKFVSLKLSSGDQLAAPRLIQLIDHEVGNVRIHMGFENWYQVTQWLAAFIAHGFEVTECDGTAPYHAYTWAVMNGYFSKMYGPTFVVLQCPALTKVPEEVKAMVRK